MIAQDLWNRYKTHLCQMPAIGLTLDISRMHFDEAFFTRMAPAMEFERAVGFCATLVNINAYHQPGVEAGKRAAAAVLALQGKVLASQSATPQTADQLA